MLDLTFAEFYAAQYDDSHDVGVYVVKNGIPLYVGMSTSNVWSRWFYGTFRSHLEQDSTGQWFGYTPIGRKIAGNMPASWEWRIELWRVEDCVSFFASELKRLGFIPERVGIRAAEQLLMKHYQPTLNRQA